MKYTVIWRHVAEAELATLWMEAADRSAVSAAADQIDSLLRSNPSGVGQVRPNGKRMLAVSPLAVDYEVQELDRIVFVLAIWTVPKSHNGKPK